MKENKNLNRELKMLNMRKSSIIILPILLICLSSISFINCKKDKNSNMDLVIEKGENWAGEKKHGPQLVAWIEDVNGNFISTVFITEKSSKKTFNRPEALPVWRHKKNSSKKDVDAVSGATSKMPYNGNINNDLLVNGQEYKVFLEINNSFDYNDFWTDGNSGVNGQPSLIYSGKFIAGQGDRIEIINNPIGYGSVDGSNGNITNGTDNLTTALTIINGAYITIK